MRHSFRFLNQGPQTYRDAVPPEGLAPGIKAEGSKQFSNILGGSRAQKLQVERLELFPQTLALRKEALSQEFPEGIPIDVKRAVKVWDVRPQMAAIFVGKDFAFPSK